MLQDIYNQLNQINLVKTQYEFSEKWLGRSKSYFSVLKRNGNEPSAAVLFTLRSRIIAQTRRLEFDRSRSNLAGSYFDPVVTLQETRSMIETLILNKFV